MKRILCYLAAFFILSPAVSARAETKPHTVQLGRIEVTGNDTRFHTAARPRLSEKGPLRLTIDEAVLWSLEHNRSLQTERITPSIRETRGTEAESVFNPALETGFTYEEERQDHRGATGAPTVSTQGTYAGFLSLEKLFSTGTTVSAYLEAETQHDARYENALSEARLGLQVYQPVLRGAGIQVNRVQVRAARLGIEESLYIFRGFCESLVADVETAYWAYVLSRKRIDIVTESLRLAERQLAETKEMIRVGTLAESELPAVEAELSVRRQDLIDAESERERARIELLRLLNPPGVDPLRRDIVPSAVAAVPDISLQTPEAHIQTALRMRPDINLARIGIRRNDLTIVQTKNGLLPRMDFFISVGKTGYAESFSGAVDSIPDGGTNVRAGVEVDYPLFNQGANARHRRALLSRRQQAAVLENLEQLAAADVRKAMVEIRRTKRQIDAGSDTRRHQAEKARIETEKFRVGQSTNLLVAQSQRDLLNSRINEVAAIVAHLNALIKFYYVEGSLLLRRGIDAPGGAPVK